MTCNVVWLRQARFRPLTGIVVLISYSVDIDNDKIADVFPSPYGDCGSYLAHAEGRQDLFLSDVSVPLRGLWFLSRIPTINKIIASNGFRPLTGIVVLISKLVVKDFLAMFVSVPLRGLWFLSFPCRPGDGRFLYVCFRPLTGIVVLIQRLPNHRHVLP